MGIGKLFMFGFIGKRPTKGILDLIRTEGLGGVILFRRNIESAGQLMDLTAELRDAAGGSFLIGIDQEGGRVSNLPSSIIDVPPMEELGKMYVNHESTVQAHKLGHEFGEKLMSFGINLDFAPVLDVHSNDKNPIIGNRAFSNDPDIVAKLAYEVVRGMSQTGLIACGKHFPGHGDTAEDSHHVLPRLKHDMERLERVELVSFRRAIEKCIPSLMSAHVVYEGVDPVNPATLSEKIIGDLLRRELKFQGVLFSDDMEMRAISDNYKIGDASVRAINAGCDTLLICHMESQQRAAIESVKRAIGEGKIEEARVRKSVERISKLGPGLC